MRTSSAFARKSNWTGEAKGLIRLRHVSDRSAFWIREVLSSDGQLIVRLFPGAYPYLMRGTWDTESLPFAWVYGAKHRVSNIVPATTIVVINQSQNKIAPSSDLFPSRFAIFSLSLSSTEIETCIHFRRSQISMPQTPVKLYAMDRNDR